VRSSFPRYIFIILFSFFIVNSNFSQCNVKNSAFSSGEYIGFEIYYNWGIIWIAAGTVNFSVKSKEINGKKAYHLDAYGTSHKSYDWFYKVRDHFQSYVDSASLKPIWAERNTNDGGYKAYEEYRFVEKNGKILSTITNNDIPLKRDTFNLKDCVCDVLTAAYHARNINFSAYKVNDKIPMWIIISGKNYPLYIRFVGKETITTRDNKTYDCLKMSAKIIEGTIFKGGEDLIVWVTNDANHVPVLVEAKIIVGSVKAYLTETHNLRSPLKSSK
jgi:hypothetical protein